MFLPICTDRQPAVPGNRSRPSGEASGRLFPIVRLRPTLPGSWRADTLVVPYEWCGGLAAGPVSGLPNA